MPGWLLQIIISVILPLAIKLGIPELVALIPKLPREVQDIIVALAKAIAGHNDAIQIVKEAKTAAVKSAISKIKGGPPSGMPPEIAI